MYTEHNSSDNMTPTIVDIRMALQHVGALLPERPMVEQMYTGVEDMRGTNDFQAWAGGSFNREIKRIALDGDDEATDYLNGEFLPTSHNAYGSTNARDYSSFEKETQQK